MAASPPSFELLGRLLGRLHQLRAADEPAALRPGGAWHHLLPAGSPAEEIVALRTLLHDARHRVPAGAGDRYDVLLAAAEAADGCADLPHALIHPDPVHRNAIAGPDGGATIIDWAGSGWGPRVSSLGCLLWAAAGDQRSIRAAISGYQESVTVEPAEVDRLRAAMRLRPLVLGCWTFATGRDNLRNVTDRWEQQCQRIDAGFEHARTALATGARSGGQGKQLR
jgi:Ser/Thr protein kinase RdoA (MazF antagonist)